MPAFVIHPDNMEFVRMCSGRANPQANTVIDSVLAALFEEACACRRIRFEHQAAHVGMPWNEAADGAAKHYAKQCAMQAADHSMPVSIDFNKHVVHDGWEAVE
eukprot:TRINITY_DN24220_c0_g1_i2.p2 TRINITY_DN24220_c0_g1~~TRINITY_DN24220_c0_g1_i2.p2  ORF type:complete len:103 (+),score=8.49 TRINITY_DN24220_c0_g1_i2:287-595(+)